MPIGVGGVVTKIIVSVKLRVTSIEFEAVNTIVLNEALILLIIPGNGVWIREIQNSTIPIPPFANSRRAISIPQEQTLCPKMAVYTAIWADKGAGPQHNLEA